MATELCLRRRLTKAHPGDDDDGMHCLLSDEIMGIRYHLSNGDDDDLDDDDGDNDDDGDDDNDGDDDDFDDDFDNVDDDVAFAVYVLLLTT